jgi:glycosyltransferase involved in cell wall biosynthesis
LIISPHFPPVNAADMHRVRQLLPYLEEEGWSAEVITVDPAYVEAYSIDPLLEKTIPANIVIHKIRAFDSKKTRRFGLGSLSLRSIYFFRKKGNSLLRDRSFDLVYFSTTAFHVMALGPYWKRKYNIPFVLDIQDPWRNDFYLDKPKHERPPKFLFNYYLDKWLEAYTIPKASGIIAVSQGYIDVLTDRYKLGSMPVDVIPFGMDKDDYAVSDTIQNPTIHFDTAVKNIVYIGRGGHDMRFAMELLMDALAEFVKKEKVPPVKFWFIGTDYAPAATARLSFMPIAKEYGLSAHVTEITGRVPYFETLYLLKKADGLFIPGSTDANYTASKMFPYIQAGKKLLAIFNEKSSVVEVIKTYTKEQVVTFNSHGVVESGAKEKIIQWLNEVISGDAGDAISSASLSEYLALLNRKQTGMFDKAVSYHQNKLQ